jgi:quercetin dioxygenase-like cupin family protein
MGAQQKGSYADEVAERREFRRQHLNEGLHFEDLRTFPVVERKARGSRGAHFALAGNRTLDAHISELPPGSHNNEHRHMNEALIYVLSGRGHSDIETADGERFRIDWVEGDLFSPPLNAWHVHHNDDPERPARYLAITNVPLMEAIDAFTKERRRSVGSDGDTD